MGEGNIGYPLYYNLSIYYNKTGNYNIQVFLYIYKGEARINELYDNICAILE